MSLYLSTLLPTLPSLPHSPNPPTPHSLLLFQPKLPSTPHTTPLPLRWVHQSRCGRISRLLSRGDHTGPTVVPASSSWWERGRRPLLGEVVKSGRRAQSASNCAGHSYTATARSAVSCLT